MNLQSLIHKVTVTFRYCIPMDNDRPSLDLKYFEEIHPDNNGMSMMSK